jgi:hypothetical protein
MISSERSSLGAGPQKAIARLAVVVAAVITIAGALALTRGRSTKKAEIIAVPLPQELVWWHRWVARFR